MQNKWIDGIIMSIVNDNEGEWLNVQYIINKEIYHKQVQTLSKYIQPAFHDININNNRKRSINTDKNIVIDSLFDVLNDKQIDILIKTINNKINAVQNNKKKQV